MDIEKGWRSERQVAEIDPQETVEQRERRDTREAYVNQLIGRGEPILQTYLPKESQRIPGLIVNEASTIAMRTGEQAQQAYRGTLERRPAPSTQAKIGTLRSGHPSGSPETNNRLTFTQKGVHEFATMEQLNLPFSTYFTGTATYEDGPAVAITYEAFGGVGDKQLWKLPNGQPGQELKVTIVLPESEAKKFWSYAEGDPAVFRRFVQKFAHNRFPQNVSYDQPTKNGGTIRPPYEAWDALSGNGVYMQPEKAPVGYHPEYVKKVNS